MHRPPPGRTRPWLAATALGAAAATALAFGAIALRLPRAPYPPAGCRLARALGLPEPASNFGAVVPGRLYRSARPDDTLLAGGAPALVHCHGGSDRTGCAVAAYRVAVEGWTPGRALAEMAKHGHRPERYPAVHRDLDRCLEACAPGRTGEPDRGAPGPTPR